MLEEIFGIGAMLFVVLFFAGCAWWLSRRAGHEPPPDDGQGIKFN